jgi:hypothetical protein
VGVFDCWEDEVMAEPMSIDLTTAQGFEALVRRADTDTYQLYDQDEAGWNMLAGRTLADVAAQLAGDLMQESVSLPRSAFADPQGAGRELAVLRQVATYVYRVALENLVMRRIRERVYDKRSGHALPSGRPTATPAPSEQQSRRRTTRK